MLKLNLKKNVNAVILKIHILSRYKNRPNMTFDDISIEPDQVFELQKDSEGVLEYAPK